MANSGSFNTNGYSNRYLTFNWSVASQSISGNYTDIIWELRGAGGSTGYYYTSGNFKVTIDGEQVFYSATRIDLYNGTVVASGTKRIYHNNDGNKSFSAYAEAGIYYYAVNCSGNGSWSLPQIARYSVISSAENFNDEGNPTIKFSNPSNGYFSLRAKIEAGGNSQLIIRDLSKTATSCTFNLTETERNILRGLCPNSNSLSVRFTICCMSGNTELSASYLDKIMTIVNGNPTFNNFTYKDTNSSTVAVTGNNQILVKGLSTLQATISSTNKMIAKKGATPKSYSINLENTNKSIDYSTSNINIDLENITSSGTKRLNIRAYDSRNNSTLIYKDIVVYDYDKPVIRSSIARLNNFENQTTLKVSGTYSRLTINETDKNTVTNIQYRYREKDGVWGGWQTLSTTVNSGKFTCTDVILSLDNSKAFEFEIKIIDNLGTYTETLSLNIGQGVFFISNNRKAVGVNCTPPSNARAGSVWIEDDTYGQRNIAEFINYMDGTAYATNEYIRGKRIYKKYIEGTLNSGSSTLIGSYIDRFISHELTIATNTGGTQFRSMTDLGLNPVYQNGTGLYLSVTNSTYNGRAYRGFVYYSSTR